MDMAHRLGRIVAAAAATLGLLALSVPPSPLFAADSYSEDAIKAAYLYRFAGYVNWPDPGSDNIPFIIDVLGSPGVARELRRLLPGHLINNRAPQVREITGARDVGAAQMVYVGAGRAHLLRGLVPGASHPSLLLVTDEADGLNAGSMLNFLTVDRNVRFEVSLTAADRWGLKISSELLGVAIRVRGGKRQSQAGLSRDSESGE
jgi:YfiR/HmsC-like